MDETEIEKECEEVCRIFAGINCKIDEGMAVSVEDVDCIFVKDGEEIPVEETKYVFVEDGNGRLISMKEPSVKNKRQLTIEDILKELEQKECKKIRNGRVKTVYDIKDIVRKLKERIISINEEIESFPYFEAKRRFRMGKEKRIYETLIKELVKYEDLEFGPKEDRESEKDCKEFRKIVEELSEKIGKVVVKNKGGRAILTEPMGSRELTVSDGLYGLLKDECFRRRYEDKRNEYCVRDVIEMARRKIEQIDGYLDIKDKLDAMKRDKFGKQRELYERIVERLTTS